MNKWIKKNKNLKHLLQFDKIDQKNQYFNSSYFIINKRYVDFFNSLTNIKNINVKFKLIIKMFYYLIFR